MSRLLLIIAIVVVVYLLIRSYRKKTPQRDDKAIAAEDMVRCAHCGVHLPKGESIESDGKFFCGAEHRDAHLK